MAYLKLFEFHSEEMVEATEDLSTQTPLGMIKVSVKFSHKKNSNLHVKKIFKYKNTFVFVLESEGLYVEVVRLPITPKIPKNMRVEECIAYLIRFKCLKKLQPEFICALESLNDSLEAEAESGERLIAQSFEYKDIKLVIGTEDEESLAERAKYHMWMPHRLFTDNLISCENIESIKSGIKIVMPLLQDEIGQIQFVISWSHIENNESLSTWFAVDVPSNEILKQVST